MTDRSVNKENIVMDKQIVIVVPNEPSAHQAMKALHTLDTAGVIELYAATVVTKGADGGVTVKENHNLREPWGTVLGLSTGALIGLLGGPIGVAIGAAVGGAAGIGGDIGLSGIAGELVREVGARLQPGGFAVCASAWEDWTVPLDQELGTLGATVYRQPVDDVVAAQIHAEWQALKEEEAQLETEISQAVGETKVKLEAKRAEVREQLSGRREQLRKRARRLEEGWDAKIASVKAKASAAKADAKVRHERHVEKLARFAAAQKAAFRELTA